MKGLQNGIQHFNKDNGDVDLIRYHLKSRKRKRKLVKKIKRSPDEKHTQSHGLLSSDRERHM